MQIFPKKKEKKNFVGLESDLTSGPFSPIRLRYVFRQPHTQGYSFYGKGLKNEVANFRANSKECGCVPSASG